MDSPRARFLTSPRGRTALESLDPGLAALPSHRLVSTLRRDFAAGEASALAEQLVLRASAAERFGRLPGFLYTVEGLEMMTHPLVAARRAGRVAALGLPLFDLTCGLGGDLRACANAGLRVTGLERDRATALLARANVPQGAVARGEAAWPPFATDSGAVIVDPSRRGGAGRRFDPTLFSPPWDISLDLVRQARAGVVKGPPGLGHGHVPPDAEVEFVQLGRSMREAAIWLGEGRKPGLRRAVLLPAGAELDSCEPEAPDILVPPGQFVFDPESCVTRAGLVRHLAHRLTAALLDPRVAYLTATAPAFDPLAVTFEVLDIVPFSVARLKQRLKERRWRPDEIRRRAFPVEPDELRRLLGKVEGEPVTLLCTTLSGKRTVFVAHRFDPGPGEIA